MNIRTILLNDEPRLRAGWRLLLQTIMQWLFTFGVGLPLAVLALIGIALLDNLFILQLVGFITITGSVFIARRLLDRRSITSLGLELKPRAITDLGIGILISLPMMGLIYLVFWAAGWLTFESFAWHEDALSTVILEIMAAFVVFVLASISFIVSSTLATGSSSPLLNIIDCPTVINFAPSEPAG